MTTTNIDMDMSKIKTLSVVNEKISLHTMAVYGWAFTWGMMIAISNAIFIIKVINLILNNK